uniref:Cytochrome b n=1 Tax=Diurodrilus subterraneus TaxID=1318637 RepID=M9W6L5_9ANNE|nr:cytochrome b [Diurodrilus subterraneus]
MPSPMRKHPLILTNLNSLLVDLPAPLNISTMWNFGSMMALCLVIQIMTGLFLAMHYSPSAMTAFSSVAHISLDVNAGWMIRLIHTNTVTFFFLFIYAHIGRAIYYKSFALHNTWNSGISLLILLMGAAFMGYVLPWGQMSLWALTVITNLLSAIPYLGPSIVQWFWGGFTVDSPTLNRLFVLHFMIPLILAVIFLLHLIFLHETGSTNPLGLNSNTQKIPFHPYHVWKDGVGWLLLLVLMLALCMTYPYSLGDPENFIPANPMVTPIHIKPEWYFLWAYAILRSIPNKLGGVLAMAASLLILFLFPLSIMSRPSLNLIGPLYKTMFWALPPIMLMLTWIGGSPVEPPYIMAGQISASMYFCTMLSLIILARTRP